MEYGIVTSVCHPYIANFLCASILQWMFLQHIRRIKIKFWICKNLIQRVP